MPERPLDILIWVSDKQYTIESYIEEARRLGACRKFGGRLPVDIEVGESRVFLAYPYKDPNTKKAKKDRLNGQVFAYFTIKGILVVGNAHLLREVDESIIQRVEPQEVEEWQERGCGYLRVGGTYFVSEEDMRRLQRNAEGYLGSIVPLEEPLPFKKPRWRGFKYVDGDAILEGRPYSQWFSVDEIRKENYRIRHARWLEERRRRRELGLPLDDDRDHEWMARETYAQTVMRVLNGEPMEIGELVKKCVERNPPLSTWPEWRYRRVVYHLRNRGFLKVEKGDGRERVVIPLKEL